MKKFLILIASTIVMGMIGAYVTTASAQTACSPGYSWDNIKNCCVSPIETQCRALDGSTYCSTMDDGGAVYNSNGDVIRSCVNENARCYQLTAKQATCVPNGPCDPNAPLNVCVNSTTATNRCGKTETCTNGKVCETWRGCVDPSPEFWSCSTPNPVTNKSYLRYNNKGREEVCPGGCVDGQCQSGLCDAVLASQHSCNAWGNIVNGCGETLDYCSDRNESCYANADKTCACKPKPPVLDLCTNIDGNQETTPGGMTKDTPGNTPGKCSAPDPCAGAVITTSQDYINPDDRLNVTCSIGGQPGEIWVKAKYDAPADNNDRYYIETKMGKGSASFKPADAGAEGWPKSVMKTNEDNEVSCRLHQGHSCAQKNVYVNRRVCDTRGFTATAIHATIGQEIEFNCHGGAGYGANIGTYRIWMSNDSRERRTSEGIEKFISDYNALRDRSFTNWSFAGDRYTNGKTADGRAIAEGPYCRTTADKDTPSCASVGFYDKDFTGGTVKWKPTEKGLFRMQCLPTSSTSNPYAMGRDYDNCGTRYVVVDDLPGTDVQITKSVDKPTFPNKAGEIITWTLNYRNNGPSAADGVKITDTLPDGLVYDDVLLATPSGLFSSIIATGNNQIQWTFKDSLAVNQSGLIIFKTKYVGGKPNKVALINVVRIETSTPGDIQSNNGYSAQTTPDSMLGGLVSCESNTITPTPTATGAIINYVCGHAGGTSGRFEVYSGTAKLYTVNGFNGSVTVPYGTYTTQCVIDGTVTYKVVPFTFAAPQTCAYKEHKTTKNICAVKSNIGVAMVTPLNPTLVIGALNPVPYCTNAQLLDTNYMCKNTVKGDTIYLRDDMACTQPITVSPIAKLGDRVWHDVNKNGIQDAGEVGIAGVTVSLYQCNGTTPLKTTITDASGNYLFDNLTPGSYKVKFAMPAGYDTFTTMNATGSTNDSNANSAGDTACVTLVGGENNLTIDAGVYKSGGNPTCDASNICCNGGCGGGGHYDFCGDGVVNTSTEKCDDGNRASGDGCSASCQTEGGGSKINTTKKIFNNDASCGMIDPPDVMIGEYIPFWWNYENKSDIVQVSDCNGITNGDKNKTYVLNTTDEYGQFCEFYLKNGVEIGRKFTKYCNVKQNFNTSYLTKTYLNGASDVVKNSYNGALGASYIAPNYWYTSGGPTFTKLGEYQIVWDKTSFYTCDRVETVSTGTNGIATTLVSYVRSSQRQESDNDTTCTMNLTVTKPYTTQQNGLSVSQDDLHIMSSIIGLNGSTITKASTVTNTSFAGSANLTYLLEQFVQKYNQLAKAQSNGFAGLTANSYAKVPNSNIYIAKGNVELSTTNSLGSITLIVPEGNLTIRGSVQGNVMVIVPKGTIKVEFNGNGDTSSSPVKQVLQGIYISQAMTATNIWNSNLGRMWRFGGQLKIDGLLVNMDTGSNAIADLKSSRRATLRNWFTNTSRSTLVQNGASLQIATDPSLWTSLPPGANELMKELQAFK